jgi:cell division protein FtsW
MTRLLTAAALLVLCALLLLSVLRAPAAWSPASIAVTLAAGESIVLGEQELAAPQADRRHLVLGRAADGSWWAANASAARQVLLASGAVEQRIGSTLLHDGQQLRIGAARFDVSQAGDTDLTLSGAAHSWRYDGATLWRDGRAQPACPDTRLPARLAAAWNRLAPQALTIARPLRFGGNLQCDNRLGLADINPGSATIARSNGRLLLNVSTAEADGTPLLVDGADLAAARQSLIGVTQLGAGRTRYAIQLDAGRATLRPLRNVALLAEPARQLPPQVSWTWQQRAMWAPPAGTPVIAAFVLAGLLACAAALSWQHGGWPFTRNISWAQRLALCASMGVMLAGLCFLLLQRSGHAPGAGMSVALAAGALWCCLLQPGRISAATGAALVLLAAGMLSQLELGLGGADSSLLRHFQKTVALLAMGIGAACALRLWLFDRSSVMPQTRLEWMLAGLAAMAMAALLLQVLFGDETGVFDLQPVEFAKLALTALTAHCIAVGLGWRGAAPDIAGKAMRWFRLAAPALLFLALLGLALVQVDDYSPLILLLVWGMAMAMAYAVAARKLLLGAGLASIGCCAFAAIGYAHVVGSAGFADWGFYGDRFLAWLDPASHPHTGQQLLLGARAVAEGAWWGVDGRLGLASLGQAAGSVLQVPAVQDDFAPSFFLNRHGLVAALALWLVQSAFLAGVLAQAAQSYAASLQARDYQKAWLGRFRCFALCGGAAFVLGHLLLSWGTNLAIFPIMGQPMSFLSAGGSHLLFFICPLLAMCAIKPHSLEEKPSCQSTYSTKY